MRLTEDIAKIDSALKALDADLGSSVAQAVPLAALIRELATGTSPLERAALDAARSLETLITIYRDDGYRRTWQASSGEADRMRFEWYFSNKPKGEWLMTYLDGVRAGWTTDQWRAAIDAAMEQER